ncbi:MAG: aldo/keto reductase [Armatimonadota bacterium]
MQYRMLGNTGIEVSVIGMGTEYLSGPQEAVVSVVGEAIDAGVNYFDLLFSAPEYRENYGAAFRGKRDAVVIAGHLGNAYVDGQNITTHDPALCETAFHDMLERLRIDAVDVLMLQFVDDPDDYARVTGPGGILEMALRFKAQGKARTIGIGRLQPACTPCRISVQPHRLFLTGDHHALDQRAHDLPLCFKRRFPLG